MRAPHIVVVGAVAVDVKAQSFGDLIPRADVPGQVRLMPGGVGRNTAKNLALLGANVSLMSALGNDAFGRWVRDDLADARVNLEHLLTVDQTTATWVGVLDARGDLNVGVFDGAILNALTPAEIARRKFLIADADGVVVDATLPRTAIDAVMQMCDARRMMLNPASAARAQTVVDCAGKFGIVAANALEASVLTGQSIRGIDDAKHAAQILLQRGVERAIVTLGADGIVYADANETRHLPAMPTEIVDTTGAGDALAAMFLLCHLQKTSLDETLALALRAAAITAACNESVNEEIANLWTSR